MHRSRILPLALVATFAALFTFVKTRPLLAERLAAPDAELARRLAPDVSRWREDHDGFRSSEIGKNLSARLGKKADAALEIALDANQAVRLWPEAARAAQADFSRGRAVYEGAYPSTDAVWITEADRVELFLVLHSEKAPTRFRWRVDTPPTLTIASEPSGALLFSDLSGAARLRITPPFALDALGVRRDAKLSWEEGRILVALDTRGLAFPILLDPALETPVWVQRATTGPPARYFTSLAYDVSRSRTVVHGGETATATDLADVWEWDGSTWSQRCTSGTCQSGRPASRNYHSMVYDSTSGRTVIFGGYSHSLGAFQRDLWAWNGTAWTQLCTSGTCTATRPSVRSGNGMAYDSARQRLIVFGGAATAGALSDIWEFNGTTWSQRCTSAPCNTTRPSARTSTRMTYDAARGVTVLFGGWTGTATLNDTWEWDGNVWTRKCTTAPCNTNVPPVREGFGFAYDSRRGKSVVFGGYNAGAYLQDTWEWDGNTWFRIGTTGPSPRAGTHLAFDSARGRMVTFAGSNAGPALRDTWEFHTRGETCGSGATCDTGFCVDGVCCETSACGSCQACNLAAPGTCTGVTNAPDDTCSGTTHCDGSSVCVANTPTKLAFTTPSRTFGAGVCAGAGGMITVQLQDASNNPANAPAGGRSFTASSTSGGTVAWFTDAGCTLAAGGGTFTIPAGSNTVNVYYRDTQVGSPTITLINGHGLTNPGGQGHNVTAGPATQLAFTVQPVSTMAGASITPAVRVTVRDAFGNTVTSSSASITMAIGSNPGGGGLSGTTPVTAVSGVATFSNLSINKVGTGYTLTATSAGLTGATSSGFNITVGPANHLGYVVQASSAQAGAAIAPAIQVAVQDVNGNTVTSSSATVGLALGSNPGGSTLSGTTSVNAVNGIATFSTVTLNKAGSGYTLVASSVGLGSATGSAFNITPGMATKLAISVQPTNAAAGASIAPGVQVIIQDANNNTVTGSSANIAMAVGNNPGGASLSGTNPVAVTAGAATFSNLSLNKVGLGYTLTASSAGLTPATTSAFDITPGAATKLAFSAQPSSAQAGSSIAPAIQVVVQDANNNTVTSSSASIAVAISTNPGGSMLSGTTPVTAVNGVATFSNLSLNRVGTGYVLQATSAGLSLANSTTFNITVGTATRLGVITQPTTSAAGAPINPAVQIAIQDAEGNTVTTSNAPVTVGLGANPGSSTLAGTLTVNAVNGVASFADLSLNKSGVGYTLVSSSAGFTGATTNPFNITPGAANRLAFQVQPSSAVAATNLSPAVQVVVQDANGNTVTGSTANVALAIGNNPGGATLGGTTSTNAAGGVATFSNLQLNKASVGYTLSASAAGLTPATSNAFNITAGTATQLVYLTQPSNVLAGAPINPAVRVAVQDANGNLVTSSGATVNVGIGTNPGGSTLSGTTAASASGGIATFSNLSLNSAANGYRLSATSAGLGTVNSATFDVLPATATRLVFTTQPTNAGAGAVISPGVQVEVQDNLGNTVTSSTAPVTIAISNNPGAATLGGTLTANAVSGVATFSNLSLNKTGTAYTLSTSSPGFVGAVSNPFDITAGTAASLSFAVQPSNGLAGATLTPSVQVQVLDGTGNVVTGSSASITLALGNNPGAATLGGTVTVAATAGVATFSTLSLNRVGTGYTLAASSAGLTGATSGSFNITPNAANRLAFSVQPGGTAAGSAISPAVTVLVQDSSGNTVTGSSASVTLSLGANPSAGVLSGTVTVTAVNGVATLSTLSIDKAGTGYTLLANAAGLTQATSSPFNVSAGGASRLAFSVQPSSVVAGAAISPSIQVRIEDANGNLVTSSSVGVTLTISNNPSGGALSGTVVRSAAAGIATFPGLSIDRAGAGYSLSAMSSGLTGATSTAFNVTVGAPARVGFGLQPPNGAAGSALAPAFTVRVMDASGNVIPSSTATITVALANNPGGATLSGTLSAAASGGVATFANVRLDRVGTGYTLTASSAGLMADTSAGFAIGAGVASALDFSGPPSDVTAGAVMTPAVTVAVRDGSGNLVTTSTATVTVSLAANPSGGVLGGTLSVNAVNGVATFNTLTVDLSGNNYTLSAASAGLTVANSPPFDVAGAAAVSLAFTTPARSPAAGACSPAVTVQAQDTFGNPATLSAATALTFSITGVQLFADAGCGSPLGPVNLSPGAPQASVYIRGTQAGTFNLNASATGLTPASQTQTVVPGPATTLDARGFPSPSGAGVMSPWLVTARDAFGNRATGFTGPLDFSSSDTFAQLPTGIAFTAAEQGEMSVPVALQTLGMHTLNVSSGAVGGGQFGIMVRPGPAHHFLVTGIPSPSYIERWAGVSVVAQDQFNNVALDHVGAVKFSSSDLFAVLPPQVAFTPGMQGRMDFDSSVKFRTGGTHYVRAEAVADPTVNGAQTGITVNANAPPLIYEDANQHAALGVRYQYNALGRVVAAGAPTIVFAACGGPVGFRVDARTGTVTWTPDRVGAIPVCVSATNGVGLATYAFSVDVVDRAPTAVTADFSASPQKGGPAPLLVDLDGSPSTAAPDATPLMYRWGFGDGTPAGTGITARHSYLLPGGYSVRLNVFDAFGSEGTNSKPVQVQNGRGDTPPTAAIRASQTRGRDSLPVQFECDCGEGSSPIVGYSWQLMNGPAQAGSSASATYGPGAYDVRLTVVDANGLSATDSVLIVVTQGDLEPPQCKATADPSSGDAPFSTFWIAETLAGSAAVEGQEWQFEDGAVEGQSVPRTYNEPGTHEGRLTVRDANGLTCQSVGSITATLGGKVPPRIVSAPPVQASCGEAFVYPALVVADEPGAWSLGENAPSGVTLDVNTGELRWTPTRIQVGPQAVVLIASGVAGTARQTVEIDVVCNPMRYAVGCASTDASLLPVALLALLSLARRNRRR